MVVGRRWVLKRHFKGEPTRDDFELVSEELGPLSAGEILVRAEFVSVDPYMRVYVLQMPAPMTMIGQQVGRVVESRHKEFPVGSHVITRSGWTETVKLNVEEMRKNSALGGVMLCPDIGGMSRSLLLGAAGMPGNTAYFGLLDICQPKEGETVVVNGGAGAVGSLVGQIAKIKGCKVIGYAGSDDKVNWLRTELGFDHAFNYKTTSVNETLKEAAPNGVDCFFDNVGGADSSVVLSHMNLFGRISVCGAISTYNDGGQPTMAPAIQGSLVFKQLKMEGFLVTRWSGRWTEGITQMATWIGEGRIKTKETVLDGFEKMPDALIGLFTGKNQGKMLVKC